MLSVPRSVVNIDVKKIAYHGFSDASKLAVLAAIYALVFHKAAQFVKVSLLQSQRQLHENSQSHAWSLLLHTHFASSDESCEGSIIRSVS